MFDLIRLTTDKLTNLPIKLPQPSIRLFTYILFANPMHLAAIVSALALCIVLVLIPAANAVPQPEWVNTAGTSQSA